MFDPLWIRRGLWSAGLLSLVSAGWYAWFRVDWYDYFPAEPPDWAGEITADPHTELLELRVDAVDPLQEQPRAAAGEAFRITGRLKLDPQYWAVPLAQAQSNLLPQQELMRIRAQDQKKVRCMVRMRIMCKSWLKPGEKTLHYLAGTVQRVNQEEIAWKTSWTLRRPGVYLVRLTVGEREPNRQRGDPFPAATNERTLTTFLLTVDPYEPNAG